MTDHASDEPAAMPAEIAALSEAERTRLEAAAFRRLVDHLAQRTDVQNIDLMNLAGFCRNCLANWYRDAAEAEGLAVGREASRERVYGMPYDEWKRRHQQEAAPEAKAAFDAGAPHRH